MEHMHEKNDSETDDVPCETPSSSPAPTWDQSSEAPIVTHNWVDVTTDFKAACKGLLINS